MNTEPVRLQASRNSANLTNLDDGISSDVEYETLRQEILNLFDREVNISSFGFTVTAAILSYGFSQGLSTIFLAPLIVLALVVLQLNNCSYSMFNIAVYLRQCVEPYHQGLNWETRLGRLRKLIRKQKLYIPPKFLASHNFHLITMFSGLICVFFAHIYAESILDLLVATLSGVAWVWFSIFSYGQFRYIQSGKYENDLERWWQYVISNPND